MNHVKYEKIVDERLREEREERQDETAEIRIVYTSANLVKAGQQLMRDRKRQLEMAACAR